MSKEPQFPPSRRGFLSLLDHGRCGYDRDLGLYLCVDPGPFGELAQEQFCASLSKGCNRVFGRVCGIKSKGAPPRYIRNTDVIPTYDFSRNQSAESRLERGPEADM